MDLNEEAALERRRAQNREAQRKFRLKQSLQKNKNKQKAATNQPQYAQPPLAKPTQDTIVPSTFQNPNVAQDKGSCGLALYGDINLLDFSSIEGMLTSRGAGAADIDMVDLPSTVQIADILNMSTAPPPLPPPSAAAASEYSGPTHPSKAFPAEVMPTPNLLCSNGMPNWTCTAHQQISSTAAGRAGSMPTPADSTLSGASVNPSSSGNNSGWSGALHIACQNGHVRIVRTLLKHGADCNERDSDGLTPLIHAVIGDHEDVLTSLLKNNARVGEADRKGRTALHWAVLERREKLLNDLLKCCAGDQSVIDCYDASGKTPFHAAVDLGFEAGVQLLLESGAKMNLRVRKI